MRATRRPERPSKHVRPVLRKWLDENGDEQVRVVGTMSATKRPPWAARAARRVSNRRARAARKANRGA